ncbi:anhydro-N-acetylmuramic acid kinase [Alcanivorax sediminis]|uniref:Anhydro-N-acetylmuramic acid kinase n=1 Tax=Alcanivorax sediminis TaxID=2663008 RepID=A0A6N7LP67_9GAMM|nr:anhydro-N-acetylmuramic acid kinase [Alcanivorax sediminis]MQX51612.1 anhydro-N-acetylmuramic acid kinase [Alcanivorax sediminis]
MPSDLYIGLMTGTSVDGIDAVLVDVGSDHFSLVATHSHALPEALSKDILTLCQPGESELDAAGKVSRQLGRIYAEACGELLAKTNTEAHLVTAIGCHGQTVRHRPGPDGFSVQLGCPDTLACATGIPVVSNFRNKDMVLGGQGAPLVPPFHLRLFGAAGERRAVVNIGGMANASLLDGDTLVGGFDTGPGNVLMDLWTQLHRGDNYDANGAWAASGKINKPLLKRLLRDPYFQQPPPKSTGRERFNRQWLTQHLKEDLPAENLQATLAELTARSIADSLTGFQPQRILVCGGGAHNTYLLGRLQDCCDVPVESTELAGLHPDWVEAAAFAWLAWARWEEKPGNAPVVTGAAREAILGQVTLP